jgi:hypothetical protein
VSSEDTLTRIEEFPEFSKKENYNSLMFQHNFESGGGTLISLRSLLLALTLFPPLAGQVGTGYCPNAFRPLVPKSFPEYFTRKWERKLSGQR